MARERLLAGAGEDTIHANIITAETKKDKLENWWYYNKKIVLLVALIIIMVASITTTILSREKPDYTIALINAYAMDEDAVDIVEKQIAKYGEDLNGDGEVLVSIRNYYFLINDHEDQELAQSIFEAASVKYAADMASGDSMIWLYDEYGYDFVMNNESSFTDNTAWADVPGLKNTDFSSYNHSVLTPENMDTAFSQLKVAMRAVEGSGFVGDEDAMEYYEASKRLFNNLISDSKTAE